MNPLDTSMRELRDALAAARENLLALEATPTVHLLDTAPLAGITAEEWGAARGVRASLWSDAAKLSDLLDDVDARCRKFVLDRATRDAALLDRLRQPSIVVSVDDVPFAERGLLGAAQHTRSCTPRELLTTMSARFDRVRDVVARVASVWDADVVRIGSRRGEIEGAAAELGERATGAALLRRIDALATTALTDPLAVLPGELDALDGEVAELHRRTEELARLRRDFAARLDLARSELADLDAAVRRAADTRNEIARRIAGPLPAVPDGAVDRLAPQLDSVVDLARAARWPGAATALERWQTDCARLRTDTATAVAGCRALLDTRGELRGRLDAYRAVAGAHGRAEDPVIEAAAAEAEAALYRAPCDLVAGAELLARYQALLTADAEPRTDGARPARPAAPAPEMETS